MIRIDEIYNNTFWPWLRDNRPGARLFFCDPPGRAEPDALFNHGSDTITENNFIYFHDQEPIHLDIHQPLFDEVAARNTDLWRPSYDYFYLNQTQTTDTQYTDEPGHWIWNEELKDYIKPDNIGHIIVSERGEYLEQLCQKYGWQSHYYFYHGWATQDWYRGYNYAYLIPRYRDRRPTRTFISPNRIVAGKRDHRVLFLYNVFKNHLETNHISAPRHCQYENVDIAIIAQKYREVYPDIESVFAQAELPRLFAGESEQIMSSYCLTNFAETEDSLIYVPTETVYFGRRTHLTEKTFKAIALEMPFVLVAPAHSLAYLREYGFKTFSPLIDESYDTIEDPIGRVEAVTHILREIEARSAAAKLELQQQLAPIVEYNYDHFYNGGFARILWQELNQMLEGLNL